MDTDTLTPDAEEASMRELGVETDAAQGREQVEAAETPQPQAPEPEPTPEPQPEVEQPPESPEPEQVAAEKLGRDVKTGQFTKRDKPETEYSKAQKEAARKERSWQALQAEKEQFRQYVSQVEEQQRMAQLETQRRQFQPLRKDGLTAQEYAEGARRFEQEGDYENAYKARQVAEEMFHTEQGRVQQMQGVEAEYQWRTQMQQAMQAEPQIANPDSPISQHLSRIIEQNPWIYHIPNGFLRAAEVAHMLSKMSELKEKDDEILSLKAELEKHQRKSQPSKGGFASPRMTDKDFDEMNLDEMESHLKSMTAEADNYR